MATSNDLPGPLLALLSISIVLRETAPHLQINDLLRLSATSKKFRNLISTSADAWRHLDLSTLRHASIVAAPIDVGGVSWRAERMDESLTEDEFYAGPLRGIFSGLQRKSLLQNVHTLILDRLSVPADLVREIVTEDRYSVRMLSIREAQHLNMSILSQVLRYIVRPTRQEGSPKLKALYVFGNASDHREELSSAPRSLGVMDAPGAQLGGQYGYETLDQTPSRSHADQPKWYAASGKTLKRPGYEWPETLQVCKGIITFDAVLCRGPRHDITKVESRDFLQPTIATVALGPEGCQDCKSCPERPAVFRESEASSLPLLGPVPSHSSAVRAAQEPLRSVDGKYPRLVLRCEDCLRDRWCEECNRWWCEDCYKVPNQEPHSLTELRQTALRRTTWDALGLKTLDLKVLSKLCIEDCFVQEMMRGAGSNGMWG